MHSRVTLNGSLLGRHQVAPAAGRERHTRGGMARREEAGHTGLKQAGSANAPGGHAYGAGAAVWAALHGARRVLAVLVGRPREGLLLDRVRHLLKGLVKRGAVVCQCASDLIRDTAALAACWSCLSTASSAAVTSDVMKCIFDVVAAHVAQPVGERPADGHVAVRGTAVGEHDDLEQHITGVGACSSRCRPECVPHVGAASHALCRLNHCRRIVRLPLSRPTACGVCKLLLLLPQTAGRLDSVSTALPTMLPQLPRTASDMMLNLWLWLAVRATRNMQRRAALVAVQACHRRARSPVDQDGRLSEHHARPGATPRAETPQARCSVG